MSFSLENRPIQYSPNRLRNLQANLRKCFKNYNVLKDVGWEDVHLQRVAVRIQSRDIHAHQLGLCVTVT